MWPVRNRTRCAIMIALISTALPLPALAQQANAASGTAKSAPAPAAASIQPALLPLVAPRARELSEAGVQKIVARTGKKRRDIQILTAYGPQYIAWPKGVTPVVFDLEVAKGAVVTVRTNDYTESNKASYSAAFDAIIPEALRLSSEARVRAQRPRP